MNENETHAPCEAYATAVATEVASTDNTDPSRLDEITEVLGKLAVQLATINLRLALLEGAAGYETEVSENSEHSETSAEEIAEATASEPAPTYEEEEAADPAEEREHYCHGLGKWYTRREWHALIDAINAGEIDYTAYTYKGYKYGYDDRCLNPTPVVSRCNHDGTMQVRVWLAECSEGWSYGMKVKVPGITFQMPCVLALGGHALSTAADALAMAVGAVMRLDEFLPTSDHATGLLARHKSSEACKRAVAEYRALVDCLMAADLDDYLTAHNIDKPE